METQILKYKKSYLKVFKKVQYQCTTKLKCSDHYIMYNGIGSKQGMSTSHV